MPLIAKHIPKPRLTFLGKNIAYRIPFCILFPSEKLRIARCQQFCSEMNKYWQIGQTNTLKSSLSYHSSLYSHHGHAGESEHQKSICEADAVFSRRLQIEEALLTLESYFGCAPLLPISTSIV